MCLCVCKREREREKEREIKRERERKFLRESSGAAAAVSRQVRTDCSRNRGVTLTVSGKLWEELGHWHTSLRVYTTLLSLMTSYYHTSPHVSNNTHNSQINTHTHTLHKEPMCLLFTNLTDSSYNFNQWLPSKITCNTIHPHPLICFLRILFFSAGV